MYSGDNKHIKHFQRTFGNPCNDIESEFAYPDSREQYMRASLFLSFLDLTLLIPLINSFYKVAEGARDISKKSHGAVHVLEAN